MILAYLLLLTGLTISAVAIYYSVVGLTAIFSAAAIPIIIMGTSLEVAKLVCASWLKQNWERVPRFMKYYMTIAVIVLMLITSMGIFGFLSKAHNDQNLVSGDVTSKIAIYDEKIKIQKDNIESARKALTQMDAAVDQTMNRSNDEKGADKASALRRSQAKERSNLQNEIAKAQKEIVTLNDQRAPIAAEVRKVEAEVGPIKYIAKFIYGDHGADENMLEKSVTWIIILIVIVFDPLAVIMLLGAQMSFAWAKGEKEHTWLDDQADELTEAFDDTTVSEWFNRAKERARFWDRQDEPSSQTEIEEHTVTETPTVEDEDASELAKWNKMIEEAERMVYEEAAKTAETTVEERVAKGETYIDGNGQEVSLEEAEIEEPTIEIEESKKKTYMIKDESGAMITRIKE
jgi:hypothetical protein